MARPIPLPPMKHRLTVERFTITRNSAGEQVETWAPVATRWGAVQAVSGRQFFSAEQTVSEETHKITMWYFDGLLRKDRIAWQVAGTTRIFEIETVATEPEESKHIHIVRVKEQPEAN